MENWKIINLVFLEPRSTFCFIDIILSSHQIKDRIFVTLFVLKENCSILVLVSFITFPFVNFSKAKI